MVFVLIAGAQPADKHLALATEELLQVLVLGADLLRQIAGRRYELMLLERLLGLVRLQVGLAEGAHARQAAFHGGTLLPFAHVALNVAGGQLGLGSRGQPASASDGVSNV